MGSGGVSAVGEWQAALAASGVHGAQAAKVQVDVRTGEIRVLDMVCMQDCGLPLNRMAVQSQIQGGLVQALSYGLFEERVIDADLGLALNANLEDYKIAGSLEIPAMKAIIDDEDQRPVIGMSEATIIPGHSAIANAIFNACGVRLREMPLTSDKLILGLEALAAAKKG
jgi:xanthine dehydrogenase YagR molybdenum-binding subunit